MVKIVWDDEAADSLEAAYEYIYESSPQSADKVKVDIIDFAERLTKNPERYPIDKFKQNNDGSYRAYELHRYRIAFKVEPDQIIILRLRHTSREPKNY